MIGTLRHRVTIEEKARVSDGGGGGTVTWSTVATVWASIDPVSGFKRMQSEQLQSRITHVVRIRERDGITTAMRIRLGARLFAIRSIINEGERDRWLVIDAEEGGAP